MGHVRNYSIGDALAWYKRLQGFNVLHPIGWDSFGQPAEQAAIKRGVNPRAWTEENIVHMRGQLKRLGISYDWSREIAAHRPDYYKWDQWFFLRMYERGLAYKKLSPVNWCPKEGTVLSNEQSSGGVCWRCGAAVEKRNLEQWFLRITDYAEQLVADTAQIETSWPEKVIKRQRDWVGRSEGAYIDFGVKDSDKKIRVFTTRGRHDLRRNGCGAGSRPSAHLGTARRLCIEGRCRQVCREGCSRPSASSRMQWQKRSRKE